MLIGMYTTWSIVRWSFLASVTIYMATAGLQFTAFIVPILSNGIGSTAAEGVVYNLMLAGVSAAAYREPVVPGDYIDLDGKLKPWGR